MSFSLSVNVKMSKLLIIDGIEALEDIGLSQFLFHSSNHLLKKTGLLKF